ncbi:MAG: hypothetical protein ACSLFQ_02095 [Thermoanaerobaculia bacterium]
MDWLYVWAYHRIADRVGRRAPDTSTQLLGLSKHAWQEQAPGHGRGLWGSAAWGTVDAWQRAGIKQPYNFFSPEKNLVKKLSTVCARFPTLDRDFASIFAEEPMDVAILERLGHRPGDLRFEGYVVVGWGTPKGITWIGLVDEAELWNAIPAERALAFFSPVRRFVPRPVAPFLDHDGGVKPWTTVEHLFPWRAVVAKALLTSTGYGSTRGRWQRPTVDFLRIAEELDRVAEGAKKRPWIIPGAMKAEARDKPSAYAPLTEFHHPQRSNETLLFFPSAAEIRVARFERLRSGTRQVSIIDDAVIMEAARYFPWLWFDVPLALEDLATSPSIEASERFEDLVKLMTLISLFRNTGVGDDVLLRAWTGVTSSTCFPLVRQLVQSGFLLKGDRSALGYRMRVNVAGAAMSGHEGMKSWLRALTAWFVENGNAASLRFLEFVWRDWDKAYADHIRDVAPHAEE